MVKYTRPVNSRVCYENIAVVIANPSAGGVQMEGSQQGFGGCRENIFCTSWVAKPCDVAHRGLGSSDCLKSAVVHTCNYITQLHHIMYDLYLILCLLFVMSFQEGLILESYITKSQ